MSTSPGSHPVDIGWVVAAASFGFALVQLDVTIVNVALPAMGTDLKTNMAGLQWVVDAYALTFSALLLTAGALGDRLGAKRMYLSGFLVFAIASMLCGLASAADILIAGRAFQGVGAALMLPTSLAVLNHACHDDRSLRAKAVGAWTAAGGVAIAAGPIVGGLLLRAASWRSIFFVNLPVCALGALLTWRVAPESPRITKREFDPIGQILAILALAGLTGGIIEARPRGLNDPVVITALLIGAMTGAGFVRAESRNRDPMLPLRFFRLPSFSPAVVFGFIVNLTYYGIVFVLTLYLQRTLNYSALRAGSAYLPLTATFVAVNFASGWLCGRIGSRFPMVAGALIAAGGFALLTRLGPHSHYSAMLPAFLLIPIGVGLAVPAMTTAILSTVQKEASGIAAGVLNAARQAGGALGVAIFGAFAGANGENIVSGLKISAVTSVLFLITAAAAAGLGIHSTSEHRQSHASGQKSSNAFGA